jgi:hypothetical protein
MTELPVATRMLGAFTADQNGRSLSDHLGEGPLLLVFLRHLGCVFNRPALHELAASRHDLERAGLRVALVHMATDRQADLLLGQFGLADLPRFADGDLSLYRAFGLRRLSMRQLMTAETVRRGVEVCVRERRMFSVPHGDPMQMPGYFLIQRGRIVSSFVPERPWELPDFRKISEPLLMQLALL